MLADLLKGHSLLQAVPSMAAGRVGSHLSRVQWCELSTLEGFNGVGRYLFEVKAKRL